MDFHLYFCCEINFLQQDSAFAIGGRLVFIGTISLSSCWLAITGHIESVRERQRERKSGDFS